jgi:SAM-dependent methyltransferase
MSDKWHNAEAYQAYMGRWSQLLAAQALDWLAAPAGAAWLDVGCGTGALSRAILAQAAPRSVLGVDPSEYFVEYARAYTVDARARFEVGDAMHLPVEAETADAAVAGLVLNFVADSGQALNEMKRALRPGGLLAAYVWDYADGMKMVRPFFDAATALDPAADAIDEGRRFPLCQPGGLEAAFAATGLRQVEGRAIEIVMRFRDFDDYWRPFLGGVGPAPRYLVSLPLEKQTALKAEVRRRLPEAADGSIQLTARAWAAKGLK